MTISCSCRGLVCALLLVLLSGSGCRARRDQSKSESVRQATALLSSTAVPNPSSEQPWYGGSRPGANASADAKANALVREAREQLPLADTDSTCVSATQRLAREDPELLLVVARLRGEQLGSFTRPCLNDQRLVEALRGPSTAGVLVNTLREPDRWRFEAQLPWLEATRWLLEHSERIFVQADPKAIEPLLNVPHLAEDRLRSGLLVALIHIEPKSAHELLREWAPRMNRPDPRFVTLFMREYSVSIAPLTWLEEKEGPCDEPRKRALFDGIRRTDKDAPRTLLAFLDAPNARWTERALAVRFFIDAVIRLGAPVKDFNCRKELDGPCRMTSVEGARVIDAARSSCLASARAWLRANSG